MANALWCLMLLLLVATFTTLYAFGTAKTRALEAERASQVATGLRLIAESQAMLAGARIGGDESAILRLVSADRITPSAEARGALLDALSWLRDMRKLVVTDAPIAAVAVSPDGRRIVSGSADNTLRLWNAETGAPVGGPLEGHTDRVWSVAFSPDGLRIVSGSSDTTLRLWNAETGKPLGVPLEGHSLPVLSVAFSPDGRHVVSGSADKTVRLWMPDRQATRNAPRRALTISAKCRV